MDQQLFNHLVYWALKYYQVRMFAEGEARTTQIDAARYFFTSLWNSIQHTKISDEHLDDLLNEEEIDVLAYQYRLVNEPSIIIEIQDYYTQLVVRKLNYYSHSNYSWTMQTNDSLSFWEYLLLTHQIELGIGLLSGLVSSLTFMANQSQVATIASIPGVGVMSWFGFYYYQWQRLHYQSLDIPEKYVVNPHRQYKIWLPTLEDSEIPGSLKNYILQTRETGTDGMVLVYDRQMMSAKLYESLVRYCKVYDVKLLDIREEVFPLCRTNEERQLIQIYEQEIAHLYKGGSLKAASQVLRWLRPIYELGLYTDLDITLDLRNLPRTYAFKKPILFNIGHECEHYENKIQIDSDSMMVVDVDDAQPIILKIQNEIIKSYITRYSLHLFEQDNMKRLKQWMRGHDIEEGMFEQINKVLNDEKDALTLRKQLFECLGHLETFLNNQQQEEMQELKKEIECDVIRQTSGGGAILRTIFPYLLEQLNFKSSIKQISEYGFEQYDLSYRFRHQRDDEEKYEKNEHQRHVINTKKETVKVMDLKQEIVDESAKRIQRFFKVKVAPKQEVGGVERITSDWELISRI